MANQMTPDELRTAAEDVDNWIDPERDDGITYIQAAMRAALIAAQEARDDF